MRPDTVCGREAPCGCQAVNVDCGTIALPYGLRADRMRLRSDASSDQRLMQVLGVTWRQPETGNAPGHFVAGADRR